jgi:uncharacterized protein YggU (UPF0235/DUF167 family)
VSTLIEQSRDDTYAQQRNVIRFNVHVHPGSRGTSVGGAHDGALKVHVMARAVNNAATRETLLVLAEAFGVRPSAVTCTRGAKSREKFVSIDGEEGALRQRLAQLLAN